MLQRFKATNMAIMGALDWVIVEGYSRRLTFRTSGVDWFPRSC
jgi:hypothetical protein